MLQRIQSVFLFIAFLLALSMFFFPFWETKDSLHQIYYTSWNISGSGPEGALYHISISEDIFLLLSAVLNGLITLFPLFLIFQFQNRKRQALLSGVLILFQLICGVSCGWLVMHTENQLLESGAAMLESNYLPAVSFPLLAVVFTFFARRAILKDEAKVRSMDRIR